MIFVSHDRYFVDRLATKIVAVGHGAIEVYPGTYEQFLWSRTQRAAAAGRARAGPRNATAQRERPATPAARPPGNARPKPRAAASPRRTRKEEGRRRDPPAPQAADDERDRRVADLEGRIAEREQAIKDLEAQMAAPGFYDDRAPPRPCRQAPPDLMWEVGDLMHQWEALQAA